MPRPQRFEQKNPSFFSIKGNYCAKSQTFSENLEKYPMLGFVTVIVILRSNTFNSATVTNGHQKLIIFSSGT